MPHASSTTCNDDNAFTCDTCTLNAYKCSSCTSYHAPCRAHVCCSRLNLAPGMESVMLMAQSVQRMRSF
eukprot:6180704-Pleurochrysis_carterae.AAC.1